MTINRQLLAIIGRRLPAVFDVIPRGPLSRGSESALNPQPLPPLELGVALGNEFLHVLYLAERFGLDQGRMLADLDDWCPTRPKPVKLPPWWPPVPEPEPQPDWYAALHFGFAARLAAGLAGFEGTSGAEFVDNVIERSLGALDSLTG